MALEMHHMIIPDSTGTLQEYEIVDKEARAAIGGEFGSFTRLENAKNVNAETAALCFPTSTAGDYAWLTKNEIYLNGTRPSNYRRLFFTDSGIVDCQYNKTETFPAESSYTAKLTEGHIYKFSICRRGTPTNDEDHRDNFNVGYYDNYNAIGQLYFTPSSESLQSFVFKATNQPIVINMFIRTATFTDLRYIYWVEDLSTTRHDADNQTVPVYWDNTLDEAIAKIQVLDGSIATHGDSFVWLTDYHVVDNANHSAALIKEILASTAVDKVFYGGDTINRQTTKDVAFDLFRRFWRQFRSMRVYPVYGNHDNNDTVTDTEEVADYILTYNETYSLTAKHVEQYGIDTTISPDLHNEDGIIGGTNITWRERWGHTESLGKYYYVDNAIQKIRYIVLDGYFPMRIADEVTWFENLLNATEADWTVVVLCHAWWRNSEAERADGNVEKPYDTAVGRCREVLLNYISNGGPARIACWICGHLHHDGEKIVDTTITTGDNAGRTYRFPVIITCCDCYNQNSNMTINTVTEQAFDVVHVDTYNQTVKCTRVGFGSDRLNYTYGLVT